MATTNLRELVRNVGLYNGFGIAQVTAASGNTSVTASFPELQAISTFVADVRTSAGLQKPGFIVTLSGQTVTVANNGSTTTLADGDVVTILAYSSRNIK